MRSESEREAWALVGELAGMLKEANGYTQHRPRCAYYSYPLTCSCGFGRWMQDIEARMVAVERIASKP